jgi:nondiscriminating aspartyl-tRNA synthetase
MAELQSRALEVVGSRGSSMPDTPTTPIVISNESSDSLNLNLIVYMHAIMGIESDLGDWRRTHHTSQLSSNDDKVTLMGHIASIRDHGNIIFIMLADKDGEVQLVFKKHDGNERIFQLAKSLREHSSIAVKGRVKESKQAPKGIEVVPEELRILSLAYSIPPFSVYSKTFPSIDVRLDLRAIDLRRYYMKSIFRLRHKVLKAIRGFLDTQGFMEVNTPKIISTASEGGASLFPVFYFDREAFLAQSPQLYKEQLVTAFEKVYEIAPIFRAEPSRTNRHLAEAISVDVEEAFVDYRDVMSLLESLVIHVLKSLNSYANEELQALNLSIMIGDERFPRYTYTQIIDMLRSNGYKIEWGDDFTNEHLQFLGDKIKDYYFIVDWPLRLRPFYTKGKDNDTSISESFDLMHGDLEISSGSTRINRKDILLERLKMQGLRAESFEYHLKVFDYGMPPHAGFGLGLERFLMAITGLDNIRDVTFYPRDIDRLVP